MARKVQPGDGHLLKPYRWWQLFSRSLFHLRLSGIAGAEEVWSVDVRPGGDSNGEIWAQLYLNGHNHARSKLPAAFAVPGGAIEVAISGYGIKRCPYVTDDGTPQMLAPEPGSAEGRRLHLDRAHPVVSRIIGVVSVTVLIIALVVGVPQIIGDITRIPSVADAVGTFVSPFHLPVWANISLVLAALIASTERALRMRYNWILDGGFFDGDF